MHVHSKWFKSLIKIERHREKPAVQLTRAAHLEGDQRRHEETTN